MIFEYEEKYAEEVKDLLVELQEHIVNIDKKYIIKLHLHIASFIFLKL